MYLLYFNHDGKTLQHFTGFVEKTYDVNFCLNWKWAHWGMYEDMQTFKTFKEHKFFYISQKY